MHLICGSGIFQRNSNSQYSNTDEVYGTKPIIVFSSIFSLLRGASILVTDFIKFHSAPIDDSTFANKERNNDTTKTDICSMIDKESNSVQQE